MRDLRALPSVEQLLQTDFCARLLAEFGRPLTLGALRTVLDEIRAERDDAPVPQRVAILLRAELALHNITRPTLLPVINASGVVLHTNLGRAPLSRAALQAVQAAAQGYTNLEYDLVAGSRGQRSRHAADLLTRLTGAEAALVVNNNAAAVLLALSALAAKKRVIIARSQLVEIGGGFRVPDVMKQSGARLVEVGATNRVHAADFVEALGEPAALLLRAHSSNFRIVGFTSEPSLAELAEIAHSHALPLVDDLGSGALLDTARYGLAHEPTVQESIAAGADVVCFSGDKLLGGPQAGMLVGRADLLAKIQKHPLARAVRADKLCLAALSATLLHYLKDEAEREIPVWRMVAAPPGELRARAGGWAQQLGAGEVIAARSTVGGGSLPEETLPTFALALHVSQPNAFLARLRTARIPVIARVENGQVIMDARTVLPEQDSDLLESLRAALQAHPTPRRKT